MLKKIPHTYTIIFSIILLCAVLSWIIPAGEYSRHTVEVNGTTRSVIVDNYFPLCCKDLRSRPES